MAERARRQIRNGGRFSEINAYFDFGPARQLPQERDD
jgi:hypothetical protein